jgi:hypothetical protein
MEQYHELFIGEKKARTHQCFWLDLVTGLMLLIPYQLNTKSGNNEARMRSHSIIPIPKDAF